MLVCVCRCIRAPPTMTNAGKITRTRVIDDTFFVQVGAKKCLRLATVTGVFQCKYYMSDGLADDVSYILESSRSVLKSPGSNSVLDWKVLKSKVPDVTKPTTTSFGKVVYTLWVRLVMALLANKEVSATWMKPEPLPFFQHNRQEYLDTYMEFNILNRLKHDQRIRDNGQNCDAGKPIIEYGRCSDDFARLYREAAVSFDKYARKHGSTIVPAMSALVWPGLSASTFTGRSVPAWSLSRRKLRSTFARWILDEKEQCPRSDVDNTVCAYVGASSADVVAAIPWLGGDYNPWWVIVFS